MFSQSEPSVPQFEVAPSSVDDSAAPDILLGSCASLETGSGNDGGQELSYSSRLMQHLGVGLWHWLFDGSVRSSLDQSQGIAIGQGKPMRLRLDVRDPDLTNIPWEIMQPEPGMQAISLGQQLLFSRTTSAVDPLVDLMPEHQLNILLVLGQPAHPDASREAIAQAKNSSALDLEQEAEALIQVLQNPDSSRFQESNSSVGRQVDRLVQPTVEELTDALDRGKYNVVFYAGHGVPGPDGGMLFLRPDATLNGTELAQALTRNQIKLAVFNACWGAQPERSPTQTLIPRSSLAEVLVHHGVPAVLAMRDTIADTEALSFIKAFTQALVERYSIDQAVAIARQQLLTLYRFNQPAWTLPVLYMHPQYDGELIKPIGDGVTEIPEQSPTWIGRRVPFAFLRGVGSSTDVWPIQGGLMRIGKIDGNDLVINEPGVSRRHAEIFYRDSLNHSDLEPSFYLRDYSRYGTLLLSNEGWRRVHQQEIPLQSQTQIKFGSHRSQALEFVIELTDDC
jgi:hypothetical protein